MINAIYMSTIFFQQILSDRLLLVDNKVILVVSFELELITTYHLGFIVKNVMDIVIFKKYNLKSGGATLKIKLHKYHEL